MSHICTRYVCPFFFQEPVTQRGPDDIRVSNSRCILSRACNISVLTQSHRLWGMPIGEFPRDPTPYDSFTESMQANFSNSRSSHKPAPSRTDTRFSSCLGLSTCAFPITTLCHPRLDGVVSCRLGGVASPPNAAVRISDSEFTSIHWGSHTYYRLIYRPVKLKRCLKYKEWEPGSTSCISID